MSCSNGLFGTYDVCFAEVTKNLNWNASDGKGGYPCRDKPCYTEAFVANVINSYAQLVFDKKIPVYDREKNKDKIVEIEKAVTQEASENPLQVAAVLYEMYNTYKDKKDNPICYALAHKSNDSLVVFIGGGIFLATIGILFLKRKKIFSKKKTTLKGLKRSKRK